MKFHFSNILCLLFFSFHSLFSQVEWNSKRDKIVIPFELSNNLIIIDVEINNVKLSMILDTGSSRNLLFSFPENDSIEFFDTRKVKLKGLGLGDTINAYLSRKNKFKIKDLQRDNFEILLVADNDIHIINKLGLPINGIIGYNFFMDFLVEINYQKRKIFLYKQGIEFKNRKLKKYSKIDLELLNEKPYVSLISKLNNVSYNLKLLFDTGLGDGLWLFENDSLKCSNIFFKDVLGRGLGGDVVGKKSRVNKLLLSNFILNDALVSFPDEASYKQLSIVEGRNGSLGGEVIKRFNWFIDYKNEIAFFKPNKFFGDEFNYNMSGVEIHHSGIQWVREEVREKTTSPTINANEYVFDNSNAKFNYQFKLKPVFEIYSIRENSPGMRAGLKAGDIIVSINNKKAYYYSIQKITDLFQSENGKKIIIVVEREGEILKFKFELEKIL